MCPEFLLNPSGWIDACMHPLHAIYISTRKKSCTKPWWTTSKNAGVDLKSYLHTLLATLARQWRWMENAWYQKVWACYEYTTPQFCSQTPPKRRGSEDIPPIPRACSQVPAYMNNQWTTSPWEKKGRRRYKVTHCAGCVLANTKPYQLCWVTSRC